MSSSLSSAATNYNSAKFASEPLTLDKAPAAVYHPVGVPLGGLLGLAVGQPGHHVVLQGPQRQQVGWQEALHQTS